MVDEAKRPARAIESAKNFQQPVERASNHDAVGKVEMANEQKVSVAALHTFPKDGNPMGEMANPGDTFEMPRHRAAELRANGLIEYADAEDEKAMHGEEGAKVINERVQRQNESAKLKERDKSTPLKNPKLAGQE